MADEIHKEDLIKVDENTYEIPKSFRQDMRVTARIFVNENMLNDVVGDRSLWQLVNVATLPGIQKYALAMPDIHEGYGFPIGGVAAMAINEGGVISPGGIGYDINCGVRLLVSNINRDDIKKYIERLATDLFHKIPSGVGKGGKLKLSMMELDKVLKSGAAHMLAKGYGTERDLEFCEENGSMAGADYQLVSERAKKRGADQLGTLGSGNHFLEVQAVDKVYDQGTANIFGLSEGLVTVMIHCGSRGLGHQVCTDYVRAMLPKIEQWKIQLPDKELVCAPFNSDIAQEYFAAMQAAANFAWANRHMIAHWVREVWESTFGQKSSLNLVYDLSHNIGKVEMHTINDRSTKVLMHRKGATRAFGPGCLEIPAMYRGVGQPVLIPGTMGTSSYVLAGTKEGMDIAFGSSCHGAGRRMSRAQAKRSVRGSELREQLQQRGIIIRSDSDSGLAEEAPLAYKDVDNVVRVVDEAKLAKRVARLVPLAVIKGG
jgi:tRNA-splicing ligase RtcB (3'-phosphate/5'-hydroxy nucleic acid ligase)